MMLMQLVLPTHEEVEKIKSGDLNLINKYYFDNLNYLKKYVGAFCFRIRDYSEFDDYLQEIYLNFARLDFDNERFFGHSCFQVFCIYHYGDQRKRGQLKSKNSVCKEEYILDSPVKCLEKQGDTLADIIPDNQDIFEKVFCEKIDITESLYNFLSKDLAKEQRKVFEQFYYTGKTYNEIAQTLGKNVRTVKRTREECFKKFRKHLEELQEFLIKQNYYSNYA